MAVDPRQQHSAQPPDVPKDRSVGVDRSGATARFERSRQPEALSSEKASIEQENNQESERVLDIVKSLSSIKVLSLYKRISLFRKPFQFFDPAPGARTLRPACKDVSKLSGQSVTYWDLLKIFRTLKRKQPKQDRLTGRIR